MEGATRRGNVEKKEGNGQTEGRKRTFLMAGSSHSYQRALHCLADFLLNNEAILPHWYLPYFITAALRISSYARGQQQRTWQFSTISNDHGGLQTYLSVLPGTSLDVNPHLERKEGDLYRKVAQLGLTQKESSNNLSI